MVLNDFQIVMLASGSKGNAALISTAKQRFLVDIGISCRALTTRMKEIGVSVDELDGVFITHEHVDHVRGLDPWPVATAMIQDKRFKIYAVRPVERTTKQPAGTLLALTKQGLEVACGDGVLVITQLQAEGGKRMAAADYFRGHPITL